MILSPIILLVALGLFRLAESCTSFYCLNSCGSSSTNKGYKLILANNRDEDIYRLTQNASQWPSPKKVYKYLQESRVYGPLDLKNGEPPNYYSTWLGINSKGNIGNLLFFMANSPKSKKLRNTKNRGIIVSNFLLNDDIKPEGYLEELNNEKNLYGPFNYLQLTQLKSGEYVLFYINNNDTNSYRVMNTGNEKQFIFGLSNSDPERPFQKVTKGKITFNNIIQTFSRNSDKESLVNSLIGFLQNKTENMPDENLARFMQSNNEEQIKGISKLNANYTTYWKNAATRTSTLILVDYENNVEYYELNMTTIDEWQMNKLTFKLTNAANKQTPNIQAFLISTIFLIILNFKQ